MQHWTGSWEFNNFSHHYYGRRGNSTVKAPSEAIARKKIKMDASKKLFGTTMMQSYFKVVEVRPPSLPR